MVLRVDLRDLFGGLAAPDGPRVEVEGRALRSVEAFSASHTRGEAWTLSAGDRIPAHFHKGIDDVFVGVRGEGTVTTWGTDGEASSERLGEGCIVVVGAGTPHMVTCGTGFVSYVLIQSPPEHDDFEVFGGPVG